MGTDRIEMQAVLDAPLERVWQAVSDPGKFGEWFGVAFDGPFVAGREARGHIVPTRMDREVAKLQEPYTGMPFRIVVASMEAPGRFAFRWHPFAIDREMDYSGEPMTTVTFALAEAADGTSITITESGFDAIPAARRAQAYAANEGGWAHQLKLLEKFVVTRY